MTFPSVSSWYIAVALVLTLEDVLATAEFTIPIIILSMVSLRPLMSRMYSIASNSQRNSPLSASKDKTTRARASKADFSAGIWKKRPANLGEMSDSEVELTLQDPGKIHRVEEISIKSEPWSSWTRKYVHITRRRQGRAFRLFSPDRDEASYWHQQHS